MSKAWLSPGVSFGLSLGPVCAAEGLAGGTGASGSGAVQAEVETALVGLANDLGAETVLEIVELYLVDGPRHIVEVRTAVAQSDSGVLRRAAHTLKSTSATIGAMELSKLCFEVERLAREQNVAEAAKHVERLAAHEALASAAVRAAKPKIAALVTA
jgi:HPt (histidine-containing phosphotransfer) domain-containing protein